MTLYLKLIKINILISSLLSFTVSFALSKSAGIFTPLFAYAFLGIMFSAAGAAALNHTQEKKYDAKMERTKNRPIASNKLSTKAGYIFSISLIILGSLFLLKTNALTFTLNCLTILIYNGIYTPLKRISIINTYIGTIPGALPALCGWAASTGQINTLNAWFVFLLVLCWQCPHFFTINWIYKHDYHKAGFKMIASVTNKQYFLGTQCIFFSILLIIISLIPSITGLLPFSYAVFATSLGLLFLLSCIYFSIKKSEFAARLSFRMSLIYLITVLTVILSISL